MSQAKVLTPPRFAAESEWPRCTKHVFEELAIWVSPVDIQTSARKHQGKQVHEVSKSSLQF